MFVGNKQKRIFEKWNGTKRTDATEINDSIQSFNYQYLHKRNKITSFVSYDLTKGEFITSSAEMKSLFLLFPFIFSQIIDIGDQEYRSDSFNLYIYIYQLRLINLLRKIIMICFAYSVTEEQINCLQIYIKKYIQMHDQYYKNSYPKLHYLVHIPDCIEE